MPEISIGEIEINKSPVVQVDESQKKEPAHIKTPQEELREVSESPVFDSSLLLQTLTGSRGGNEIGMTQLLQESAGVWEGYSIKEHTQMAMGQFERYFADGYDPSLLSKGEFRIMLALHDIGKPLAIKAGDKRRQHEYTRTAMEKVLKPFTFPDQQHAVITEIANQDHLGSYMQDAITSDQAAANIEQLAQKLNVPIADLTKLLITYYMCDAGSYTQDAGGERSLDGLFVFNREGKQLKGSMKFAQPQQTKLDALIKSLGIKPKEMRNQRVDQPTNAEVLEELQKRQGVERATRKIEELGQMENRNIFPAVGMLGDGNKIEGQQIDFIKHPKKTLVHFRTTPQMTDRIRDEVIPNLPPNDVKDGRYELIKSEGGYRRQTVLQDNCWVIKIDKDTTIYVSKGDLIDKSVEHKDKDEILLELVAKTGDSIRNWITQRDDPPDIEDIEIESHTLKGGVRIEVRGVKDPKEIAQRVNLAFDKLQIPDALIPPGQETETRRKEASFRFQHLLEDEQAWNTFREQYRLENGIDILDNLERKEVLPGYYVVVDRKAENRDSKGDIELYTNLFWTYTNTRPEDINIPSVIRNGLLSRSERLKRGIDFFNTHIATDLQSGGAQSVFLNASSGRMSGYYIKADILKGIDNAMDKGLVYGDLILTINPKVLGRTDWFASPEDNKGSLDPRHLAKRLLPTEMLHSREIMMQRGIPPEMFENLIVDGERQKAQILQQLRSAGINDVNGKPIEEFVIAITPRPFPQ